VSRVKKWRGRGRKHVKTRTSTGKGEEKDASKTEGYRSNLVHLRRLKIRRIKRKKRKTDYAHQVKNCQGRFFIICRGRTKQGILRLTNKRFGVKG